MEELKVTGIVLSSADLKENDKNIEIFTVELGKINAILKGVKKANAKLKFAGAPFCFANFILSKNGDRFSVIQVDLIETFFEITSDYDSFMNASKMLKLCKYILKPNILSESLFVNLLNSLKLIVYDNLDSSLILLKFILETLSIVGYACDLSDCSSCHSPLIKECYLDLETSALICNNCSLETSIKLNPLQFSTLRILNNTEILKLGTVKLKNESVMYLLANYLKICKNLFNVTL